MRLAYRWAHLAIRRLDLGQRYLKGGVRYSALALLLALPLLLTGCATPKNSGSSSLSLPPLSDPLEPVNRMVFGFNDGLDRFFIRPVAVVYAHTVPSAVRLSVSNFFSNLQLPATIANDLLQILNDWLSTVLLGLPAFLTSLALLAGRDTKKTMVRPWPGGDCPPGPTWCCRCWGPAIFATPSRLSRHLSTPTPCRMTLVIVTSPWATPCARSMRGLNCSLQTMS